MAKELISNSFQDIYYQKLSELIDVSKLSFKDDLYVIQVEDINKNVTQTGFFKTEDVHRLINKEISINELFTKKMSNILLMNKGFLKDLVKYGTYTFKYFKEMNGEKVEESNYTQSKNIFKDIKEFELIEVIRTSSPYTVKDVNGMFHLAPIFLDRIESDLTDRKYHLDEFAEYLASRDDIAFVTYTSRWATEKSFLLYAPLKGDEKGIGGIINDTEFHTEEGETYPDPEENMQLVFFPKQEDIPKIVAWDRQDAYKTENYSRGVWSLEKYILRDLLGGEKFFKYPPKEKEVPVRKFKH